MTRVEFHVLRPGARRSRDRLLCSLAAEAWREGHTVFLHAESPERARTLDELLWTFEDTSFVPHELQDGPHAAAVPVLIGWQEPPQTHAGVLINLSHPVPGYFSRFERVLEAVDEDPLVKAAARERYRFYQSRGYTLEVHDITGAHG